jgi:hypothetical protein
VDGPDHDDLGLRGERRRSVAVELRAVEGIGRLPRLPDLDDAVAGLDRAADVKDRTGRRARLVDLTDGEVERAVRLAAAADRLRRRQGTRSWPVLACRREQWLAHARTLLDDAAMDVLWQAGGAMSSDEAIALALEE